KAFLAGVPGAVGTTTAPPYSAFTDEIIFVVGYGGGLTPTWKFIDITSSAAGPSVPLLNAMRTKTQDITITLGPAHGATAEAPAQLTSDDAKNSHQAALIGQAVGSSIESQVH